MTELALLAIWIGVFLVTFGVSTPLWVIACQLHRIMEATWTPEAGEVEKPVEPTGKIDDPFPADAITRVAAYLHVWTDNFHADMDFVQRNGLDCNRADRPFSVVVGDGKVVDVLTVEEVEAFLKAVAARRK